MEKRRGGGGGTRGVVGRGARRAGGGCNSVAATRELWSPLLSQQVDWAVQREPASENVVGSGIGATHPGPPN